MKMQKERSLDSENCLAHHVVNRSDEYLGELTVDNLAACLYGAAYRAMLATDDFPLWKIEGVLCDEILFHERFGIKMLHGAWKQGLDINVGARGALLETFRSAATWRIDETEDVCKDPARIYFFSGLPLEERSDVFWPRFLKRPAMHCQSLKGWSLYCFLQGMTIGGDWLGIPRSNRACKLKDLIFEKSLATYGTTFAGFRMHATASDVIRWAEISSL